MADVQAHRGPDDEGFETFATSGGSLALGFRRLAIQDLSLEGHQPMRDVETGTTILFNGEIYNFQDLRAELQQGGACFRGRSDTEVILHAYVRWGEAALSRLQGMFALAIFRPREQRLLLARDALGIKPLYVASGRGYLVFASELRAIHASGLLENEIDRGALAGFLAYGAVPEPLTMFKGTRMLQPGSWAEIDLSGAFPRSVDLRPQRFWTFPMPRRPAPPPLEARAELHGLLSTAVRSHLVSDVPVGVFLSSGIDSTAVTTLCSEIRGSDVDAFTVSLGDSPLDEGRVAERTARSLGIRYHNVALGEPEVLKLAQRWMASIDQPTIDGLNTYIVSSAVRERGIVVALSGLGGDEIFGGYSTFREVPRLLRYAKASAWIPKPVRAVLTGLLFQGRPAAQRRKAKDLAVNTRPTLRSLSLRRRRLLSDDEMEALGLRAPDLGLDEDFLPAEAEPDRWLSPLDFPLSSLRILESRFYMRNMLLRDTDVFGMAHGLEIRVPLLDQRVVDYSLRLPDEAWFAESGVNKPLLVASVGRLSPDVTTSVKRGFSLPHADWMAGPLSGLFEQAVAQSRASGLLEPAAVARVWNDFLADRHGPTWSRAWALGVFGQWIEAARSPGSMSRR
jgi:asparagine synthase (glutamine-hydrolysing)